MSDASKPSCCDAKPKTQPSPSKIEKSCCGHDSSAPTKTKPSAGSCCGDDVDELHDLMRRFWIGLGLTLPVLILAMGKGLTFVDAINPVVNGWTQYALTTAVVFWAGWPLLSRALESVRSLQFNMFTLIGLGTLAAWGYSLGVLLFPWLVPHLFRHGGSAAYYFESAAVITILVLLGQVLEARARAATGDALSALMRLVPQTVWRLGSKGDEEVPLSRVLIGDILRVKPGAQIPVDGLVLEGNSSVDEAMLTGESMPVSKTKGSKATAGTVNGNGSFIMRAERVGNATMLSQIVAMVTAAQQSRAPIQRLADRVARWFVPSVVGIAVVTFLLWLKLGPEPRLAFGIINAVSVLIIACPCALGLATPMALTVGIGRGALLGILIKDAEALETLDSIDTLMLDKTGTLTEGHPSLTFIHPLPGQIARDLLTWAASLETSSEHPLAQAFVHGAKERGLRVPSVEQFVAVTGAGVAGMVDKHEVALGNEGLMGQAGVTIPPELHEIANKQRALGSTVVFMAVDGHATALFAIGDKAKTSSAEAIAGLHAQGLKIRMVTGDHASTAHAMASALGIDEVQAEVGPKEKLYQVYSAREAGRRVAFAGDGINDGPALAAADVGIAMGTGTDVAINSAGVTLIKGDLSSIHTAIALSRATLHTIRQNLWFAFLYNGIGIAIAAGILYPFTGWLLNPMIASAAMCMSSISVILNSLRLRNFSAASTHLRPSHSAA
jgi:P-type Cu+ transporter